MGDESPSLPERPSPPPGWYPNPSGAPGQRYWDGKEWTIVAAPPAVAAPPRAQTGSPLRTILIICGVVLALVGGCAVACTALLMGSTDESASTTPKAAPPRATVTAFPTTRTTTTSTRPPGPARSIETDGVYLVGVDIVAGTYRSPASNDLCYWERLSGTSGTFSEIIANGSSEGPQVVTISPSDVAFKSQGCQTWTLMP
jgi:hypothetical protein